MDSDGDDIPVRDTGSQRGRTSSGRNRNEIPNTKENELKRAQERRAVSNLSREELEDRYLRQQEENLILKKHARKQEEKIKKMATKLLRLVSDRKKQVKEENSSPGKGRGRDLEMEETLEELQDKVRELERHNDMLKNKLSVAKQQLSMSGKRTTPYNHVPSRVDTGIMKPAPPENFKKGLRVQGERSRSSTPRVFRNDVLPRYGHSLLEEARAENQRLEDDIVDLQDQIMNLEQDKEHLQGEIHVKQLEHEETLIKLKEQMTAGQRSNIQENVDMIRLQRELQEKTSKMTALEAQCAALEENLNTVKTSHDAVLAEMEELNKQLHEEQGKVFSLTGELKQSTTLHRTVQELNDRIHDLEKEKEILREANEKLLNSAFDAERERQYRANEKQLKLQIAQLEATLKGDLNDKNSLLDKLNEERDEYEKMQKENRELQVKYYQVRQQLEELQEKMKFFTKESALDWQELEEALILVKKRRDKGVENLDFLERVEEEVNKDLKLQLGQLQADHAETANELEKTRNMLLLQYKINKDYQQEVEESSRRMEEYQTEYETKLQEYAQLLDIRAARIKKLENQLRDVAYGTKQYKLIEPSEDEVVDEIDETVKLERGQNLVELHIGTVTYTPEALRILNDNEPTTFVTYEFFEHEIQSTPVLKGKQPHFNFTSQYKVTVDDFFLHYLMKGTTTLELHQAIGTEFKTIAACQLKFRDLLDKPKGRVTGNITLLGVASSHTGVNFGTLEFWVRLRVPMEQALRLFRERVKALGYMSSNQRATQKALATLDQSESDVSGFTGEAVNELVIKIIRCNNVKARNEGVQPNPYSVYRFFDCNDHDTTIVTSSNSPEFNDMQVYPVPVTVDLDRYLRKESLEVFLFDDNDPEEAAYLGIARIPLISLAHDKPIRGTFELKKSSGETNGNIDVFLKWQRTYIAPQGVTSEGSKKAAPGSRHKTTPSGAKQVSIVSSKGQERTPHRKVVTNQKPPIAPISTSTPKEETKHQRITSGGGKESTNLTEVGQPRSSSAQVTSESSSRHEVPAVSGSPVPPEEPSVPFGRHDDESSNSQVEEEGTSANGIEDNPEDESQGTYDVEDGDSGQEDEVESEMRRLADVDDSKEGKDEHVEEEEEERLEDLVAQELRDQFGETTVGPGAVTGKMGAYNDTMFEEDPIPEEDEDQDSSIGEEVDIPVAKERDEEEEDDDEEADSAAGGSEMGAEERSSDSEVVMTPTVRPQSSTAATEDTVIIALNHLSLEPGPIIDNETIQRLYVEYRFLGVPAEETETPYSLPKPTPYNHIAFNFRRVFHIDTEKHKLQRDYLASFLMPEDPNDGKLRFTVVSEPPEDRQDLECEDVGYSYVDLRKIFEGRLDMVDHDVDIVDAKESSKVVGTLNVSVECVAGLTAVHRDLQGAGMESLYP
ncbi:protein fantom-like isoform X2 [Apostichopus japonicus]|uniref:protein fantom-like isoform X2 n=1 Tax=Stichopus japonicus TaxID=307972 RepID=UPI003AB9109D